MEQLHTKVQQEISGSKVLRLSTVTSGEHSGSKMNVEELRGKFINGGGLANNEVLLVDGEDVISRLPRPEEFGNRCLALMDLLDSIPGDTTFILEDDENRPSVAAD